MTDPAAVTFGGVNAASTRSSRPLTITATAPAHAAGLVQVQVTTPVERARTPPAMTTPTCPLPTVTAVVPIQGPEGGGTVVTITGTDFTGIGGPVLDPAAVTFGGTNATTYTVDSPTQITATAPTHAPGLVQVQVTTPGGASADTAGR